MVTYGLHVVVRSCPWPMPPTCSAGSTPCARGPWPGARLRATFIGMSGGGHLHPRAPEAPCAPPAPHSAPPSWSPLRLPLSSRSPPARRRRADPGATSTSEDACADITTVKDGTLTVATSDPAYPPYVIDNKPTNGKGFESATAYAVAKEMGFAEDQVEWTFADFGQLFAPGDKDFDFAINQIGITPKREQAVTFSDPYYEASNGVLVLKDSEFADVTSLAELQDAKIGVQIGTTALDEVETQIAPTQEIAVFDDTTAVDAGAVERSDRRDRHRPADHPLPRHGRGAGDGGRAAAGCRRC